MTLPDFLMSSGDVLADRRYEYARHYIAQKDIDIALDLLQQISPLTPHWPVLPFQMGCLYMDRGDFNTAIDYFKLSLQLDAADHQGASLKIAHCQNFKVDPVALPTAFVKTLFDQYATRFDAHLLQALHYKVPQIIFDMVMHTKPDLHACRVLDLGCGTGLAAEFFAHNASWIIGVDLSPLMLAEAEQKSIYNQLIEQDLLSFLSSANDQHDLIIAADVLTYFGELEALFTPLHALMSKGSLFCFSIQLMDITDKEDIMFQLEGTNRFVHSPAYIERALTNAGLHIISKEQHALRQDRGNDVMGVIYVCEIATSIDISPIDQYNLASNVMKVII